MAKVNQLTSAFLKTAPSGKHLDGLGLWYVKRPNGGSQWMLRISLGGKRREMGLGGFPDVSLKEARGLAADYRKMAKQGIDPIKKRSQQRREALRPESNLAVSDGDLTPIEATRVMGLIDSYRRTLELTEIEERLQALEAN